MVIELANRLRCLFRTACSPSLGFNGRSSVNRRLRRSARQSLTKATRLGRRHVATPGDEIRIESAADETCQWWSGSRAARPVPSKHADRLRALGIDASLRAARRHTATPRARSRRRCAAPGVAPGGPPPLASRCAARRGPSGLASEKTSQRADRAARREEDGPRERASISDTTNRALTTWRARSRTRSSGPTGTSTIPSMITFDPAGVPHRSAARPSPDHGLDAPVYGSKRLLGRTSRPRLAEELQSHCRVPASQAEGQRFGVRIDDRVISMDTIAATGSTRCARRRTHS